MGNDTSLSPFFFLVFSSSSPFLSPLSSPPCRNSPESSPRPSMLGSSGSPRRHSLFQLGGRARRSNSVGNRLSLNNSPRTAASLEYLWLLRPETRELVDAALRVVDNKKLGIAPPSEPETMKNFLDRCLFSTRVQEQERVRELSYCSPLWGGSQHVFEQVLMHLRRINEDDRKLLGPVVLSSILSWLEYDSFPSLDERSILMMNEICSTLPDEASWRTRVMDAAEHAAKNFRSAPIIFPSLAPPETVRLQFVDLLDLDRRELAEEIVHMAWRIFCSIRTVEWASYMYFIRPNGRSESPEHCENILSLIQFTKSLKQWVRTTLALRGKDKARTLGFWISLADAMLSFNSHHMAQAIFEAIESCVNGDASIVFGFPAGFPANVVSYYNKIGTSIVNVLPDKLTPYLQLAVVATTSTDKPPHLVPLSLLLSSLESIVVREERENGDGELSCPLDTFVGIVQSVLYMQQGIRHYGYSAQALSHDMHDLLQEMPLLPDSVLIYAGKASRRGQSEPDYSDDTWSSDTSIRRSSDLDFERKTTPPKSPSVLTPRTPSPVHGSPTGTPRATGRSKSNTGIGGSLRLTAGGNDRSDLGLSIASRVLSQRGANKESDEAHAERHAFLVSASGQVRFEEDDDIAGKTDEDDDVDKDSEEEREIDVLRFILVSGIVKVSWIRGLDWLARVLVGTSPIGFSLHVVDDILFGWRLIFTKPSQLFRLLISQYPDVPAEGGTEHLLPNQIFSLDSVRAVRKRVLYVIKRLVDIERSCASTLADDTDLMECWHTFYWRLKTGSTGPAPSPRSSAASPRRSSTSQAGGSESPRNANRFASLARGSAGPLHRQQSLQLLNHCMDEFVCASTIDWSLRNAKVRVMVPTVAPPADYDLLTVPESLLAEQLTTIEQNAFCGIGVSELLGFHHEPLSEELLTKL